MFIQGYASKVGLALATSANGTARNGASLSLINVEPGSLVARCQSNITTASVVATFKWQVSMDGTNFYDLKLPNNAANVATAAGTGTEVITYLAIPAPWVAAYKFARAVATLSGATTAADDKTQVDYDFLVFGNLT